MEYYLLCPLGLVCTQMAGTLDSCDNHATCFAAHRSIYPVEVDETPDDTLSDRNPYLRYTYYRKNVYSSDVDERAGWFWLVAERRVREGYSIAVDAELAAHYDPGVLTVIKNRLIEGLGQYHCAVPNRSFFFEIDGSPVTLIEWFVHDDGRREIRQIYTESRDGLWWCDERKDGTLLCSEGMGESIEGEYWLRDDQPQPQLYGDRFKQVDFPTGDAFLTLKGLIEQVELCQESFYCQVCTESTCEGDYGWSTCKHLRYIDQLSSWGGVGYGEEDFSEDYQEAFKQLAQTENADAISLGA